MNHDEHYKNRGFESIDIMESLLVFNVPEEHHEVILRNFRSAMAFKYQSRLGLKDDPVKELQKAENWIHRAKTGEWLRDERPVRLGETEVKEDFGKRMLDEIHDELKAKNDEITKTSKYEKSTENEPVIIDADYCPSCGACEIPSMTPRTVFECGSSTYDNREGAFTRGDDCNV
jgi:NAD-dependent dihydropyrimidine dehydrogenase PreA subunit